MEKSPSVYVRITSEQLSKMHQALIIIEGRVQGVAYRYSAQKRAQQLAVCGYAKNLPDGSVEILAQGEKENLDQFIEWCREGPPVANVDRVEVVWQEPGEKFSAFETL